LPWSVAVEDPEDPARRLGVLTVRDRAVATSGGGARFVRDAAGRRRHHLLDARTGFPAEGCRSVTIVAPDAIVADGLATAVFVLGPERGLALIGRLTDVEALIVAADGTLHPSPGLREAIGR
jgi:thiamine biosynthesis lipoprotein